jgi:hypothetical protein
MAGWNPGHEAVRHRLSRRPSRTDWTSCDRRAARSCAAPARSSGSRFPDRDAAAGRNVPFVGAEAVADEVVRAWFDQREGHDRVDVEIGTRRDGGAAELGDGPPVGAPREQPTAAGIATAAPEALWNVTVTDCSPPGQGSGPCGSMVTVKGSAASWRRDARDRWTGEVGRGRRRGRVIVGARRRDGDAQHQGRQATAHSSHAIHPRESDSGGRSRVSYDDRGSGSSTAWSAGSR